MSQTTTARGRGQVATPDLGFDTNDGGTALFAAVNTLFTFFSDHIYHRYVTATVANGGTLDVMHYFGLAVGQLRYQFWESATQRTAAQVAADYTVVGKSGDTTNGVTITNTSGGSKTFVFVIWAGTLGVKSTDFDPAVSISSTGTATFAGLQQSGDTGIILNSAATETGANWKGTIKRPTSGMTADAIWTMPSATATLATLGLAETLDLKTLTGCAGITLAAAAPINWAAGNVAVGASIGANTMSLGGSSSTIKALGILWSVGQLQTDANSLILNFSATESGASWKGTLTRPTSGMTADATWTLPSATGTLATLALAEVFTNKDYDGGTASNTSRMTIPKAATATLSALTRKQGTIVYDTSLNTLFFDDGSTLRSMGGGGGGGGGGLVWHQPDDGSFTPASSMTENGELVYLFGPSPQQQALRVWMKVPQGYVAGSQIKMRLAHYSPGSSSGTMLLQTLTRLIRRATDAVTSTAHTRASTNTAITVSSTASRYEEAIADLTDTSGQIGGTAVAAGDLILVQLTRDTTTDTDTNDVRFVPSATEVTFQ